jgi:hypothetical protein
VNARELRSAINLILAAPLAGETAEGQLRRARQLLDEHERVYMPVVQARAAARRALRDVDDHPDQAYNFYGGGRWEAQ